MDPSDASHEEVEDAPFPKMRSEGDQTGTEPDPNLDTDAQAKFDELKRRAAGLEGTIDAHIEAAERQARERAAAIIAQAKQEAKEVRADTQALIDQARERVNELMHLRQALFASLRDTLSGFEGAIAQAEEERVFTEAARVPPEPPADVLETIEGKTEPSKASVPPPPSPSPSETETPIRADPTPTFTSEELATALSVEIKVGPLKELESVNAIESALGELPATRDVSLRSFDDGVAVLEASGIDVNTLLTSMRLRFNIPFILRDVSPGKLAIQVDEFALRGRD